MEGIAEPGLNMAFPFLTKTYQVQVTVQTDTVKDIPCGTSGGVMIKFDKIEVVNRLKKEYAWETVKNYSVDYDKTWIFDKIHHEINQYCSKHTMQEIYISKFDKLGEKLITALQEGCAEWAPGIEIIDVRTSKPRIPDAVLKNYVEMEVEKANLLLSKENQEISRILANTELTKEKLKAENESKINGVINEANMLAKRNQKLLQEVDQKILQERTEVEKQVLERKNDIEKKINDRMMDENLLKYSLYQKLSEVPKVYYESSAKNILDMDTFRTKDATQP